MLIVLGLVGAGLYLGRAQITAIFWSNPYLNGAILLVFVLGVLSCFGQVAQLMRSVQWIEGFTKHRIGSENAAAPGLLAPLATLLRSRGAQMQLSSSSGRSILDSVAQRIDEDREITRYIGNTLIFLGLLGTFYGLATTVPALVETIRSLNPADGEDGADIFARLQSGLESQLGGMGTAFSSSLLGLAGSLVVGLLELFASHGQNRFYRELEEWLSTITRLGFSSGDEGGGETGVMVEFMDHMAQQMEAQRASLDHHLAALTTAISNGAVGGSNGSTEELLARVADGQERLIEKLRDSGVDGIDAESRMRLRSIDVQMLRILEEMSAGRQETVADLRADIASLTRAVRSGRVRPPSDGS
ncbi:MAG: biopolymer transporter ExbB [Yoonia sp.]|nr:biopolymer transporter ExbB [Yoonia sp.]MDG1520288.1 biopolymer transporter ExbB [Yoonia sp.]